MDWLFDTASFMTRNHCGRWDDWVIVVNQSANFLIFLSYVTIPLSLSSLWRTASKKPSLKGKSWMLVMFMIFILFCGLTHLMDVLAFSWAPYRFFTLIDFVTAVASVPTAVLLPAVIKEMLMAGD